MSNGSEKPLFEMIGSNQSNLLIKVSPAQANSKTSKNNSEN